ncbi:MAG: flagellar protein FliT [Pseudomonadota bacterium]
MNAPQAIALQSKSTKIGSETLAPTQRLAAILETTRSMLELAEAEQWDEVSKLEQHRREELQQCFADPVPPEHGELVAEALAVLLHLNKEMMGHLARARDLVLEQGAQQARTRSALGQYQRVQDSPS